MRQPLPYRDDFERKVGLFEFAIKRGNTVPVQFSNDQNADNFKEYDFRVASAWEGKIVLEGLRRKRVEKHRAVNMNRTTRRSTKENVITLQLTFEDAQKFSEQISKAVTSSLHDELNEARERIDRLTRARDLAKYVGIENGVVHEVHGCGMLMELDEESSYVRFEDCERVVDTLLLKACDAD